MNVNLNQIGAEVLRSMAVERAGTDPALIAAEGDKIQADPVLTAELQRRIKQAAETQLRQQAMAARARR